MRSLDSNLTAAQQASSLDPAIKITLTLGATEYVLEEDRIKKLSQQEAPDHIRANEVELDNSDGYFNDKDLKGYDAVISWGLVTKVGRKYSDASPMVVTWQQYYSSPGKLVCILTMLGVPDLLDIDEANDSYIPLETDTKSVKTLINEIAGATLACFSHCVAYNVVWDSGYDALADTYIPKDSFRVYTGGSRFAAIKRLMGYTGNVLRFPADGKLHILKPVTTGVVYDYEYSRFESGHTFFSKAYRNTLVLPNYIIVKSQKDDTPQYSGYASDAASYALLPKRKYYQTRLQSNAEATSIAQAILSRYQLNAEMGAADVPMNCGAELHDYNKFTDETEGGNDRTGNIGSLTRTYNADNLIYNMRLSLGDPPVMQHIKEFYESVSKLADEESVQKGIGIFERLYAKDGYIENLSIDNISAVWLDPDSNIDLSQIGDTLDNLPDGEVYARVQALHMDAGQIKLDEHILYASGYNPTEKMPGDTDLDGIPDGEVFKRVKSAALTAAGLVILDNVVAGDYGLILSTDITAGHVKLSQAVKDGEWYNESGVEIDAAHGINIFGVDSAFTTRASKGGTIQCKVDSAGRIVAGGGNVKLDVDGIRVIGNTAMLKVRYYVGTALGSIYAAFSYDFRFESTQWLTLLATGKLRLYGNEIIIGYGGGTDILIQSDNIYLHKGLVAAGNYTNYLYDIKPYDTSSWIGTFSNKWAKGYFTDLPACPVPTSNSALAVIKKIKAPKVMKGKYGRRHYFKDEDFPDEMKIDIEEKDEKGKVVKVGGREIEFVRTIGVLVEGMRELTERLEAVETRVGGQ